MKTTQQASQMTCDGLNLRVAEILERDVIDADLGEVLSDNEEEIIQKIAEAIATKVRNGPKPAIRDAHPKAHGCVHAEFRIVDHLDLPLAQGVFKPGVAYPAYIRFSNGNPDPKRPDAKRDVRGMAIKLLNVFGEKILPDERDAQTQDFILVNHPVFFMDDPAGYLKMMQALSSSVPLAMLRQLLALGFKGTLRVAAMTWSKIASPLEATYWSQVPYRLGDGSYKHAVKYRVRPHLSEGRIPDNPTPNFLRETMIAQLEAGSAAFDFEIQVRTSTSMSVETSTIEWKESEAPFIKAATITIPKQTFATPERHQFGENLSFTPWHALPQHRPLGAVNRVRRVVYDTISGLRHELNGTERREPT
jgi:hypothetical protein